MINLFSRRGRDKKRLQMAQSLFLFIKAYSRAEDRINSSEIAAVAAVTAFFTCHELPKRPFKRAKDSIDPRTFFSMAFGRKTGDFLLDKKRLLRSK